jgi:hypothetical protein
LTGKAGLRKLTFHVLAPTAHAVAFMMIPPMHFYLGRETLHKLLKFNQNHYICLQENRHFVFWGCFEGPVVLKLEYSDSLGTEPGCINPSIPNMNKFHPEATHLFMLREAENL